MSNYIPIVNYIIHILDDTSHYMSNSVEHIIIINEFLREQEDVKVEENIFNALENIYISYVDNLKRIEEIENSIVRRERDRDFVISLSNRTLGIFQDISSLQVRFIALLGELEQAEFKSLFLLMISHITIEERYGLEIQSKYINGMQSIGFW